VSRRWIDKGEPHPSSSLVYQAVDGQDTVLRVEMPGGQPGSMVTLELFPMPPLGRVVMNGTEAISLGRRLLRMGEKANILGPER
jgi:hypothetical protein